MPAPPAPEATDLADLLASAPPLPERIVCLTEETTEILYRIGAGDRVVGVSGFTVRPPEAGNKPKVSSFLDADFERILELEPDLVLGFSDLQADLARELIRKGAQVLVFNQRSVAEILQTIRVVAALVGLPAEGESLVSELTGNLETHAEAARSLPRRPRVFFEEWHEPLICGIRWCSELVELVGGEDICRHTREQQAASGRVQEPEAIARLDPEVVIASWCGRKVDRQKILERPGWESVSAVLRDQIYEIASTEILQPGPAALSDGVDRLARIVGAVARGDKLPRRRRGEPRRADL